MVAIKVYPAQGKMGPLQISMKLLTTEIERLISSLMKALLLNGTESI